MGYQRFTVGPKLAAQDWPLQLARGAMAEGFSPSNDFVLNASMVHDYLYRNPEGRIQYAITNADLVNKHGIVAPLSDASHALDTMIVATYREGVELYRVLGKSFVDVKTAGMDSDKLAELQSKFQRFPDNEMTDELHDHHRALLERDGTNIQRRKMPKNYSIDEEHLAGCLHVLEMMQMMRAQASASLLAEEGLMGPDDYEQVMERAYQQLAAQGHMGPYALAKAHPSIDAFLRADKRSVVVEYSHGREAYPDIASTSHFTRAAYFNSEERYIDASKWVKPENYLSENTYPQAMGEWYRKACQQKTEAAMKAANGHVRADHAMTLESLTSLPAFDSVDSLEYDRFKRSGQDYVAKHGIALMQPEVVAALDKAGEFTPTNSFALDLAFHHGYKPPYLAHIHDLCVSLNGQARAVQVAGADSKALPEPKTPNALSAPDQNKPWAERKLLGSGDKDRMGRFGKG